MLFTANFDFISNFCRTHLYSPTQLKVFFHKYFILIFVFSCQVNCRSSEPLQLSADKHLARIEVFNSLAVTAPQIEVDRLRYDRRYNMSGK